MVMGKQSSADSSLSERPRIRSGPHALSGLSSWIFLLTVSTSIWIADSGGPRQCCINKLRFWRWHSWQVLFGKTWNQLIVEYLSLGFVVSLDIAGWVLEWAHFWLDFTPIVHITIERLGILFSVCGKLPFKILFGFPYDTCCFMLHFAVGKIGLVIICWTVMFPESTFLPNSSHDIPLHP